MSDHYQTLGVAKNATPDDIKKAYRRQAGIHHPDKGGDTAEFQKIQQAYETLSDPQKKQEYDNPNPFSGQGGFTGGFPGGFQFHMNGMNMNDIFGHMFGSGFANPNQRPHMPSYRTVMGVSLEQAYNGDEQTIQFQSPSGLQAVKITIPKGVQDGATLRYDKLIPDSILLVEFRIHPHPKFERDGPHLYSIHDVDVLDLLTGGKFNFTTISGKTLEVNVPEKTQPGHKLRLSKEGMPVNGDYGDQYILLKPYISDNIDKRIIDAIKQARN